MAGVVVLAVIIGYLLGSIPFAYIAGRLIKGIDIRQVGGGNAGALNTMREVGTAAGFGVLFADIAKGALAVLIAQWLGLSLIFVFIAGFAAVVGHNWPVFLHFRGGKGVATALGMLLVLAPIELLISFAIVVTVVLVTGNATFGLTIGLPFLPLIIWLFGGADSLIFCSLTLVLFLGLGYLPSARRSLASAKSKKDFIIDRRYKPWQRRK